MAGALLTEVVLTEALLASVAAYAQALRGRRVWLACSGGRDSLSLAILCRQLFDAGRLPFLPQLLHVNHGMQEANMAWSQQVMRWAQAQNMACQVLTLDLQDKSEQGARNARYEAMLQVMNAGDVLMLGHHQDDQVETVLMRLFTGAGVTGLGGMRAWSIKGGADKQVVLWRPWLEVSRAQITAYAQAQQLDYIDDPTNVMDVDAGASVLAEAQLQDRAQMNDRAWLRSVLMPCVLQRYPQAAEAIARSSQLLQAADSIITDQVQSDLARVLVDTQTTDLEACYWQSVLDIERLLRLSYPRQSSLIHTWLSPLPEDLAPSKRLVDAVLALAVRDNPDHQTCLYWDSRGEQYHIRRYQQHLYRLSVAWDAWLDIEPVTQRLQFDSFEPDIDLSFDAGAGFNCDADDSLKLDLPSKYHVSLKAKDLVFDWQLHGVPQLMVLIHEQLSKLTEEIKQVKESKQVKDTKQVDDESTQAKCDTNAYLKFEPLPRQLKLALAGRSGRKAGKKLLQTIGQPSFMRASVVLCSLVLDTNLPVVVLFLVTTNKIVVLQSPLAKQLQQMVASQQLTCEVFERV